MKLSCRLDLIGVKEQVMVSYISRYKLIFLLSWIVLCLIYPSWALPIPVTQRFLIYCGLIIYFSISSYFMNRCFNALLVDKPIIVQPKDLFENIKSQSSLLIACCIAIVLHIYTITSPISNFGDEAIHLQGGLWVYDYLGRSWHRFLQILLWIFIIFVFIWQKKTISDFFLRNIKKIADRHYAIFSNKYFIILIVLSFFILYFVLFKDISYDLMLIRYPSTSKLLYLIPYLFFGITHIGPRIVQIIFYVLSGIYLYRTINLFFDKEAALLGASIFFFSPVVFLFSRLVETASGTVLFMMAISFYFLRFIKDNDDRDLILTSFFIGTGALFKQDILLMFFVCSLYLILNKLKNEKRRLILNIKVLLISLIPVIPWMVIGKLFNWRNYSVVLSHFSSLDLVTTYLLMIPEQASWIFIVLFVISIIYILIKKQTDLSVFFGFVFLAFYLFYVADITVQYKVHRFSVSLYPAIAVFLSLFICDILKKTKWKHSFKIAWLVVSIYLIVLSTSPSLSETILATRTWKFPSEKAMQWIKGNVKNGEKILILRILPAPFYMDAFNLDQNKIINISYDIQEVSTPETLKMFCIENKITYLMIPWNEKFFQNERVWAKKKVFDYIRNNNFREFMEISKFNLDDNYIFIYRVN